MLIVGLMLVVVALVKANPAIFVRWQEVLVAVAIDRHGASAVHTIGVVVAVDFIYPWSASSACSSCANRPRAPLSTPLRAKPVTELEVDYDLVRIRAR